MAISDEKIREKKGITLFPGMAGMTRDIVKQLKEEGAELLSVDIMVTQKCNFKCSYCYADSAPEDLPEFTMEEAKDIISQYIDRPLKREERFAMMRDLKNRYGQDNAKIADILNSYGILTASNKTWNNSSVSDVSSKAKSYFEKANK